MLRLDKKIEPRWLRPTKNSAEAMASLAREEIASARLHDERTPVMLNAMFHNVEIIAGASPYAGNEQEARVILDRLEGLLAFAQKEGIAVIGLSDTVELFA